MNIFLYKTVSNGAMRTEKTKYEERRKMSAKFYCLGQKLNTTSAEMGGDAKKLIN